MTNIKDAVFGKTSDNMLKEQLISAFRGIVMLPPDEVEARVEKIRELPTEAIFQLLKVVGNGFSKQHDVISALTKRDPKFISKLGLIMYEESLQTPNNNSK